VIRILEFKTFLTGTGYPTSKNTRTGMGMGKILYPRVYMGNPTSRIFLMDTGMEWYYPMGMYPLPYLSTMDLQRKFVVWCAVVKEGPRYRDGPTSRRPRRTKARGGAWAAWYCADYKGKWAEREKSPRHRFGLFSGFILFLFLAFFSVFHFNL
jgi:hypothetical protein